MKYRRENIKYVYITSVVFLIIYSLRHAAVGVDLWDGGYNYANFRYTGLEYMDSMWYFATWTANSTGHILTKLPGAGTMLGLNVYTSLLAGIMAAVSYGFCVRRLRIPAWLTFIGEITALSLCWAPSGVLYNYLTYALLLAGTMCLYQGLVTGRGGYLILAGAALGLNVGVRFSNLVQAGLILAVWYHAFIGKKSFSGAMRETGLCVLGYAGAYGVFLLWIAVRYGLGGYVDGIMRLFQMTEYAEDYSAVSMLASMAGTYYEASYWLKRFGLAAACAVAGCLLLPKRRLCAKKLYTVLVMAALLGWLHRKNYCQKDYRVYESIYDPCVIVLEFTILLSIFLMACRQVSENSRLLAVLTLLTVLLTSLGGNNAVYSSINNTFLVMPCFLGMLYEFCRDRINILYLPFKLVMAVGAVLLICQALLFGAFFVYEEATGARDTGTEITKIPVLKGMHTSAQKAGALEALYLYLQENDLRERECILYGNIPGLAYYMELAPAMNVWSDLRSYAPDIMEADLARIEQEVYDGKDRPLVILEREFAGYADTGYGEGLFDTEATERKMLFICDYMERNNYRRTYSNEKYVVYE